MAANEVILTWTGANAASVLSELIALDFVGNEAFTTSLGAVALSRIDTPTSVVRTFTFATPEEANAARPLIAAKSLYPNDADQSQFLARLAAEGIVRTVT